ncbi:MAG: FAD-binding oxidoreductase [Chloroflexota bacterium]
MQSADVAVIGGGIIGMSCAYELARQGAGRVVVFDKQPIGGGTSGGSAGVICLHDMGAIYAQLTLVGYARVQELRRSYDFGFQPWGTLHVFYEPGRFPPAPSPYERRFASGEGSIYHRVLLSREELLARYPWIKPERVLGGALYPNQGYLDPYRLVQLYERLATETGRVEVQRTSPVLQIRTEGDRIATLITRRGAWRVGKVLNAAGPWGAKVAALAGSQVALTPQRIQVCVATGFEDGIVDAPLTGVPESVEGEGVWCRGELGGMLLFGQHHDVTKAGFTVDPDHVNRINDERHPESVARVYRKYWHMPKSVFLNGWCCVYGTTEDGFPIIGRDERLENFYHALGLNGHGITCHAGVALAAAELVLRGGTSIDLEPLTGLRETLDFSVLDPGRFARGELLKFEL